MLHHPNGFASWLPANHDGLFHWDFLIPALKYKPGKFCTPMDFDCVIERNGMFLIFETKQPGVEMLQGQEIALSRMVQLGRGAVTVINLQAKCPTEVDGWEVWRHCPPARPDRQTYYGDAIALFEFCRRWFAYASGVKPPPMFNRIARGDLFSSLIENPVERATIYLQELSEIDRAFVLERYRLLP